jgi:hypothetical protein
LDIYFWWMSVDGFFMAAGKRGTGVEKEFEMVRRHTTRHLYQSEYARRFLWSEHILGWRLSDRLSTPFRQMLNSPANRDRRDLVVFNPMKGNEQAIKILDHLDGLGKPVHVVAATGMSRDQVRDLLCEAKIYMDFGSHPGKDRLPREAAACGACVITNRQGSAANDYDIPIPDEYKVDDHVPRFEYAVAEKIHEILDDFPVHQPRFNEYRQRIAQESNEFLDDVAVLFPL